MRAAHTCDDSEHDGHHRGIGLGDDDVAFVGEMPNSDRCGQVECGVIDGTSDQFGATEARCPYARDEDAADLAARWEWISAGHRSTDAKSRHERQSPMLPDRWRYQSASGSSQSGQDGSNDLRIRSSRRAPRALSSRLSRPQVSRVTSVFPSTSTSIFVLRKQSSASSGLHTTGSFSLNEVFSTMGTPVSSRKASMSCQ